MKIIEEFKQFAVKGNVVDLAVGVIIGGAFGKIVTSLVNDIVMPPIGFLIGGVNFKDLVLTLSPAVKSEGGEVLSQAVTLNYGAFLQSTFDFIIIASAIFLAIKFMNRIRRPQTEEVKSPEKPVDIALLEEIRDILKNSR